MFAYGLQPQALVQGGVSNYETSLFWDTTWNIQSLEDLSLNLFFLFLCGFYCLELSYINILNMFHIKKKFFKN